MTTLVLKVHIVVAFINSTVNLASKHLCFSQLQRQYSIFYLDSNEQAFYVTFSPYIATCTVEGLVILSVTGREPWSPKESQLIRILKTLNIGHK